MSVRTYINPVSGRTYSLNTPLWRDPIDGGYLNLTSGAGLDQSDIDTRARGPWRYRAAMPLFPHDKAITLGEGGTPLIASQWDGTPVELKLECLAPTGSFKDRGTTAMISYLAARGVKEIIEDSSGNAGASVAAYAAAAKISCRIFVPASASPEKLLQMRACGADVVAVEGTRSDVAKAAIKSAEFPGAFYASHNYQPHFLEGTKTLAYELWEDLHFFAPDAIVMPVGAGSNLLGCFIGFSELLQRGEINRMPRMYAVQPTACAPLVKAWETHAENVAPVIRTRQTIAEGIVIPAPIRGLEMLTAIRETKGNAIAVDDEAIVAALKNLARQGFLVEPTSATAAAGLSELLLSGNIKNGERIVLIMTGHGLKTATKISELIAR
jgi:threonine synthase